jgi:hypothetical protein
MGKTTGGFAAAAFEKAGPRFRTLAGKHPAILPHDRSTVVLAKPAHPGLPQFHPMKTSNAVVNLWGFPTPNKQPASARRAPAGKP